MKKFVDPGQLGLIFLYLTAQQSGGPVPQAGVEEAAVSWMREAVVVSEPLGQTEGGTGEGVFLSGCAAWPRETERRLNDVCNSICLLPVGLVRVDTPGDLIEHGAGPAVGEVADAVPAVHVLTAGDLCSHREVAVLSGAQLGALGLLQPRPGGAVNLAQVVALSLGQREGESIRAEGDGLLPFRRAVEIFIALLRVTNFVADHPLLALELLQALLGSGDRRHVSSADVESVLDNLDSRLPRHRLRRRGDFLSDLGRNRLLDQH